MKQYQYDFPRPSVTATIAIFNQTNGKFLSGLRGSETRAYPNTWSLPGGFLNARVDKGDSIDTNYVFEGETIEAAAVREVFEETNIVIQEDMLRLLDVRSEPTLDPRCHVVNVCYYVILTDQDFVNMKAGDDLAEIKFVSAPIQTYDAWAFDHAEILAHAAAKLLVAGIHVEVV